MWKSGKGATTRAPVGANNLTTEISSNDEGKYCGGISYSQHWISVHKTSIMLGWARTRSFDLLWVLQYGLNNMVSSSWCSLDLSKSDCSNVSTYPFTRVCAINHFKNLYNCTINYTFMTFCEYSNMGHRLSSSWSSMGPLKESVLVDPHTLSLMSTPVQPIFLGPI